MDSRLTSLLPKFAAVPFAFLLYAFSSAAYADTYYLPGDLSKSPFNCSGSGQDYNCGSIDLSKDATLVLNGPIRLQVSGNFSTNKNLSSVNNGYTFDVSVGGSVDLQKDIDVTMNLTVGGSIDIAKDARFTGNITAGGNVHFAKDSIYDGDVTVGGFLDVDKNTYITGICRAGATNFKNCGAKPPVTGLHHIRIGHTGIALTCTPAVITVYACAGADSNGACALYTDGVSGNIKTNSGTSTKFEIPQNSGSANVSLGISTAGTVTLSADGYTASNGYTCWDGSSASCDLAFKDSAFLVTVPDHMAGTTQQLKIEAVRKDDSTQKCTPGFSGKRDIGLSCLYGNPNKSGMVKAPLSIGGSSFTCDNTSKPVSLTFDANGIATSDLVYDEVGTLSVKASLAQPLMEGSDSFTVAPASFNIVPPANPLKAGRPFTAVVSARNAKGNTTQNFGLESPASLVRISFKKCTPVAGQNGVFTGSVISKFTNGTANTSGMSWTEVGVGQFRAYLDSDPASNQAPLGYLSSSIKPDSSTACNATFVPDHFDIQYSPEARPFWYSGQPMSKVKVIARAYAAAGTTATTTYNYMLEAPASAELSLKAFRSSSDTEIAAAIGELDNPKLPGAAFISKVNGKDEGKGEAEFTRTFTFKNMKTPPQDFRLRAVDGATSSADGIESPTIIRTGRLRLSNAFGGANTTVPMAVRAEYWTGSNWLWNVDDSYTRIPRESVALKDPVMKLTGAGAGTALNALALNKGEDTLRLSKATAGRGYLDVAINLALNAGAISQDKSCLSDHPNSQGSDTPWLRSWYGACSPPTNPDNDPSARANFGVTAPETRSIIFVREVFN